MTPKLTVLIPCKNERRHIRPCIEAVQEFADEILVADSGSTDGTLEIIRSIGGCRIIEREYIDSGNFKNWAIPQAKYEWVLLVDADERITRELRTEIQQILKNGKKDGYWIYRKDYFLGHRIRYSGVQNDCCLRLFRRDVSRYNNYGDHSEVIVSTGQVGRLKSRMTHYTNNSYDDYFKRFRRYTMLQADRWNAAGRKPKALRMFLLIPFRFLQTYFLRRGFLDGLVGLQFCALTAFYSFMKEARLWELQNAIAQPDPEAEPNVLNDAA